MPRTYLPPIEEEENKEDFEAAYGVHLHRVTVPQSQERRQRSIINYSPARRQRTFAFLLHQKAAQIRMKAMRNRV